ncbi:MAG: BMP family ABC transporter substrate-binding protein [Halanaerobiaceae bacterium]|nr:BMP family ABC transporter substrate-binding protein [Halanaerobiaceae bacterium]
MFKKSLVLVLGLLLVFSFASVVKAEGRIAVVFATGGLGDKSFNDSGYEGLLMAKEAFGIEYDYAEPSAITDFETYLNQFSATRRYDLIISIGFDQADALNKIAARFPDQKYAIVDTVVDQPNVASFVYEEKERGFLLGVAAALMTTRTNDPKINPEKVIGVIGGMEIPLIEANIAGYIAGAKYIDPEVEVLYAYVGDWADPAKGKELTLSQIERGADIIWGAAGRSGLGVIMAAEEQDCYAIGADSDQGHLAPEHVLTNGMKFVNNTVFLVIEQVLNDTFEGDTHVLGVKEGGLGYSKNLLPEDIINKLEEVEELMKNKEIDIPDTIKK